MRMPVFLEAIHTVRPLTREAMAHYLEWYGEFAVPAMKRSGFDLLGAWKMADGLMGRDLVLIRFESMAHYSSATSALRKDAGLLRGRELQAGRFTIGETVKLCAPDLQFSPERIEQALGHTGSTRRRYLHTVRQLAPGTTGALAAMVHASEAEGDVLRVAGYDTLIGARGEQSAIWLLPAQGAGAERSIGPLSGRAPVDADSAGVEEWQSYLEPLPYSPMR
jgi:hypothetical protein